MIIPYTHEDLEARRWPIVTVALIAINVVCFVILSAAMDGQRDRITTIAQDVIAYRELHPAVTGECAPLPLAARPRRRGRELDDVVGVGVIEAPSGAEDHAADQAEYDRMCGELRQAIAELPTRRFGYVPAEGGVTALVTYQFLHGGWLHLLSNMWFLWLCGCNVEDRWGRRVFLPFYLSAGIAAALAEKMLHPASTVAIIGASGAIAGAMGAFLVSYARTRIRFAYLLWNFRYGTFAAPAYVMLPLWLVSELFWGAAGGDGVAHWAHVGGFAYGAGFALLLRRTGLERKLDADIERTVATVQDPRIVRAGDLTTQGKPRDALALLLPLANEKPRSVDVQLEILRAAKGANDAAREREAYAKLIDLYFEMRAPDTAADLFHEMRALGLDRELARGSALRVADHLAAQSRLDRADDAYRSACREGLVDVVAVRAALAHAQVVRRLGRTAEARDLLAAARESPFSTADLDASIDAELARLGGA